MLPVGRYNYEGKQQITSLQCIPQQQFMKFTPFFHGARMPHGEKGLQTSVSSKVLPAEHLDEEGGEVVREDVMVCAGELGQQLRHYQWRNRTEFPIVRVTACHVKQSVGDRVELEVMRESLPLLLDQLTDLPLFRVIYLLKETLIGCERLLARFGTFRLTSRMIGVNSAHKCRVWINERMASNEFQGLQGDESRFLGLLFSLFEEKTLRGKAMSCFYGELYKCNSCAAALIFIDHYTKDNKIAIPSLFRPINFPQPKSYPNDKFHPSLTMARSPKFIHSMRDTLTPKQNFNNEEKIEPPKVIEKAEIKPTLLSLKKSSETRADVYGSNTMTITDSKSREDTSEPFRFHHFLSAQEIIDRPQQKMQKSQLLQFKPKLSRFPRPANKTNNRQHFSCFTPQPQTQQQQQQSQWDMSSFLSPPQEKSQECKEALQEELQSLFERNNWQQKIGGLFDEEQVELKTSVHDGEPQWRRSDSSDFPLLQNFGKSIMESVVHER